MSTRPPGESVYHPWSTYIAACEEARRRGDRRVGTQHLVLGLLRDPDIEQIVGVSLDAARECLDSLDREALAAVGFTLVLNPPPLEPRALPARPTIKMVLKERIKLTPVAKTSLQMAGKPMRRGRHITSRQVLLALLENQAPDPAIVLLAKLGVDTVRVRGELSTPKAS